MHIFGEEEVLSIPFHVVIFMLTGCPMLAFVLCLSTSILFHYEMAVSTHCGVPNWLPSLSAVVAYAPERYIWRFLLGISCTPRLAMAFAFRNYLISSSLWPLPLLSRFRWSCHLACALNASLTNVIANLNIFLFRFSRLCHLPFLQ
uniref:CWH43-like N-terminal domain-containing protein n=1 Tax=Meloidogyne incognita TaxID=6306 RepID=A0A914KJV0_MELIC